MPLIDERGRLFGRLNLIDALLGIVVIVLLPVAYLAFTLFRTPAPRITEVDPPQVALGTEMRVKVRGTGLRSLFRANIGETPASAYLFENERSADVLFSHVRPGKYDLTLYDGVQEVARLPGAVTVLEPTLPPSMKVRIIGAVTGLDDARAGQIVRGKKFPESGTTVTEILAAGAPQPDDLWIKTTDSNVPLKSSGIFQVPVLLLTECQLVERDDCRIGGAKIGKGTVVPVPGAGGMRLRIGGVRPNAEAQNAELVLRAVIDSGVADLIKVGDSEGVGLDAGQATVAAIVNRQSVSGERTVRLGEGATDLVVEARTPDRFTSCELVLRLGLDPFINGWRYSGQTVRVGAPFVFATDRYTVRGSIQKITVKSAPAPAVNGSGQ